MRLLAPALVGVTLAIGVTSADADLMLSNATLSPGAPIAFQGPGTGNVDLFTLNGRVGGAPQIPQINSSSPIGAQGNNVAPTTPEPLTDFTISIPAPPPGYFFTTFSFKVEKPAAPGGTVTVTSNPGTADAQTKSLPEIDQQMYLAQAINGEVFRSLKIDLSQAAGDVATFKFGSTTEFTPVPGPVVGAGLPGLIAALGGLIAMARRRRNQLA